MKKVTRNNSVFVKVMAGFLAALMIFGVVATVAVFLEPQISSWFEASKS